jgi:alpha-glucosidase (family GH31 glycosyl hydrolase)
MKSLLNTTYLNQCFSFWAQVAEPDFTKATSRKWFGDSILYNAYNRGSSGWMADFGEHHRIDMIDSAYANPYAVHNEYPLTWGRTNQEFWEERQPDGDYTFWMRGGWTGIQKYAPLMWNGDTQFDWSEGDGIKSIIPSILTAGISGHPLVSAHIAGYGYTDRLGNTILPSNSEELWIRWVQTCSMFPVMWTHEGDELSSIPKPVFDQSVLTKSQFKKYSKLHIKFFPYFYTLAKEGKEKGLPVARSLYLHYPNDANCISIKDQFLLGDRVMVAPVLDSGAVGRSVYFPQGDWYDYWTGNFTASGPTTLSVSAPLDNLPIYVKEGSILPQFNQDHIETLMKNVAGVNDFGFANSSMEFRFYGCGSDQLQLWDGTTVEMQYFTGDSLTNISGGPSRAYTSTFIHEPSVNCFAGIEEQQTGESIRIYPNPTTGIATLVLDKLYNSSGTIEIYNAAGLLLQQEIFQLVVGESTKPLDVSNLANGIYHLVVRGNEGVKTIRLIKY